MIKPKDFSSARQDGMTLIEILVAIVVLSIGLLGMAGLQLKGIQVNQGSAYRWQAAMLAEDIADRMRADPVNALAGAYTVTLPGAPSGAGGTGTAQSIADWSARVQALLPGGTAVIAAPVAVAGVTNNQSISISVSWVDKRAAAGAGVAGSSPVLGSYTTTVEF